MVKTSPDFSSIELDLAPNEEKLYVSLKKAVAHRDLVAIKLLVNSGENCKENDKLIGYAINPTNFSSMTQEEKKETNSRSHMVLPIIKFLYENGAAIDEMDSRNSVFLGRPEVLKWLLENSQESRKSLVGLGRDCMLNFSEGFEMILGFIEKTPEGLNFEHEPENEFGFLSNAVTCEKLDKPARWARIARVNDFNYSNHERLDAAECDISRNDPAALEMLLSKQNPLDDETEVVNILEHALNKNDAGCVEVVLKRAKIEWCLPLCEHWAEKVVNVSEKMHSVLASYILKCQAMDKKQLDAPVSKPKVRI